MTVVSSNEPARPEDSERIIVVFTRLPVPGQVKTRLIPLLGTDGAARLQADLIAKTVDVVSRFSSDGGAHVEIHYSGGTRQDALRWFGTDVPIRKQSGSDLGERLRTSVDGSFSRHYRYVVIVGTDIPRLSVEHLEAAFTLLGEHPVVLGPAFDGGYYLIGLRNMVPGIFEGLTWGSRDVLEKTIEKARSLDLDVGLTERLRDIDTPEDYLIWREGEH